VARASKVDGLRKAYSAYKDQFDAVSIQDIVYDQFPEAFEGVDALIHIASPLPWRQSPEDVLKVSFLSITLQEFLTDNQN
jgi:hypothetical protein